MTEPLLTDAIPEGVELMDDQWLTPVQRVRALPIPVLLITGILLLSGVTYPLYDEYVEAFFAPGPAFELIDFDAERTRMFATNLTNIGPRFSGTQNEALAAENISAWFTDAGLSDVNTEELLVPLFDIPPDPVLAICTGPTTIIPSPIAFSCGPGDIIGSETEFVHTIDYVLQGYSGFNTLNYGDVELHNLSDGRDADLWTEMAGKVGVVWGGAGASGNTDLVRNATAYSAEGLIIIHNNTEADSCKLPGHEGTCIPYFKSIDFDSLDREGRAPLDHFLFVMVSNVVGQQIMQANASGGLLKMDFQGANGIERKVSVPCGSIPGTGDGLVMVGGHHDTVYNGPGAIDDTSGTSSVVELAYQLAAIARERGAPEHTIRFCTWGGEEEGKLGSTAYIKKHRHTLIEQLELYVNLDMNHVDIDWGGRGNGLWMFGNSAEHVDHIRDLIDLYETEHPGLAAKYPVRIELLHSRANEPGAVPYNSDHAPFVYELDPAGEKHGDALVCYGSGSWEYHTYEDDMDRFNEESLGVSVMIYGGYLNWFAWEPSD